MADSYQESLDYLYSLQLFGIKLGLEKVHELLRRIGNPQHQLRIIHIAGTNGKGSTAATLAAIFHAAGIPAGLYTSPHLHHFTERIRIDTQQVAEAEIVALVDEMRPHAEELQTTFFEFTTALALLCFVRHGLEWAILETGMGGRLDATNAVLPELCLLTPIALDHTGYLGDTLAAVAGEKAGIFKAGVPVISAPQPEEVAAVMRARAESLALPLRFVDAAGLWRRTAERFDYVAPGCRLEGLRPGLGGEHQLQNLSLALTTADWLRQAGVEIPEQSLRDGVERVRWPGRLEWLPDRVLLDGAHNPAGAERLAAYLRQQRMGGLHLLIGLKDDKPPLEVLEPLMPFVERLYAVRPPVDQAVAPEKLVQLARKSGILAAAYADFSTALAAVARYRRKDETLLVAGSLFLVAAIRELLLPTSRLLSIYD